MQQSVKRRRDRVGLGYRREAALARANIGGRLIVQHVFAIGRMARVNIGAIGRYDNDLTAEYRMCQRGMSQRVRVFCVVFVGIFVGNDYNRQWVQHPSARSAAAAAARLMPMQLRLTEATPHPEAGLSF